MPAPKSPTKDEPIIDGPSLVHEAIADGAEDARRTIEEVGPVVSEAISNVVYGASYGISFGACLAALTIARLIPRDSAIAQGAAAGFESARDKVDSYLPVSPETKKATKQRNNSSAAARRARGEVTATAIRITEDTSLAHA